MSKFIWRATSQVFVYLHHFMGSFRGHTGRERFRPFYFRLPPVLQEMRDWTTFPKPGSSSQHEGLGAVYDKRKWMENYYRNPPIQP